MNASRKKIVGWTILTLGIFFGVYILAGRYQEQTNDILKMFGTFNPLHVTVALCILFFHSFCLAMRFYVLMPKLPNISLLQTLHAVGYGQIINTLFPARAGEAVKIVILSKGSACDPKLSAATGTGVALADKIVDVFALATAVLVTKAYAVTSLSFLPQLSPAVWTLIGLTIMVLTTVVRWHIRKSPDSRVADSIKKIKIGIRGALNVRQGLPSYLFGLSVWITEAIALLILCRSLGYSVTLGQSMLALTVSNVIVAIPVTFANFGPYEAALTFALNLVGIDTVAGVALATTHHILQIINNVVFGVVAGLAYRRRLRKA